jgi:transposase
MFIRENKNRSGSVSVQIISKESGKYRVIKSIGSGKTPQEIAFLKQRAQQELRKLQGNLSLFVSEKDAVVESFLSDLGNAQIQVIGPELIFGRIYDALGFDAVAEELFRHLVICRLYHPGSKLKTIDYLQRFLGVYKQVDEIYRFLDRLQSHHKTLVEQIAFAHTRKVLGGRPSIVFYDLTTLHFEASDEDDLRKTGFSKVGKHQNPQIYLGLLVGLEGFPIGYDVFEGNIFEGHTLIPVLEKFSQRFNLDKPIVVADAALLSKANLEYLQDSGYEFILGARIKNESDHIRQTITAQHWRDGKSIRIDKDNGLTLIVSYSDKRARKDAHNRKRGLERLEKKVTSGKLSKANINNRGYNKYLKLIGKVDIAIDYDKYEQDKVWDGLKGYLTNTRLKPNQVIDSYRQLWHIEKAFRITKTDLQIRPIYHRLRHRIEGHLCIAFTAYSIYKELERVLQKEKAGISVTRAAELTHNMYQLNVVLPESLEQKSILLNMDEEQAKLYQIILKNY